MSSALARNQTRTRTAAPIIGTNGNGEHGNCTNSAGAEIRDTPVLCAWCVWVGGCMSIVSPDCREQGAGGEGTKNPPPDSRCRCSAAAAPSGQCLPLLRILRVLSAFRGASLLVTVFSMRGNHTYGGVSVSVV